MKISDMRLGQMTLLAFVLVSVPVVHGEEQTGPTGFELRAEVKRHEQELFRAQTMLAEARARLAAAEGKLAAAAVEWKKVIPYYEAQLKADEARYFRSRICFASTDPRDIAKGPLAVARAYLARVEDKQDVLLVELPKVVAYDELRIQYAQDLFKKKVISETEAPKEEEASRRALKQAQQRLEALKGTADTKPK